MVIETLPTKQQSPKPEWDNLVFGKHCSDHMIKVRWIMNQGWNLPTICPVENFSLHPYSKVFHYAQEVSGFNFTEPFIYTPLIDSQIFEGMKAYRGPDNRIRLFRPDLNMKRMRLSAARLCLPVRKIHHQ